MKMILIWGGLGLVVLFGGVAWLKSQQVHTLKDELRQSHALVARNADELEAQENQIQSLQAELNDLREGLAELPRLRGQVASFRSQANSAQMSMRQAKKELQELQSASLNAPNQNSSVRVVSTRSQLSVDQLPPQVQTYLQSRFPGALVREVERIVEEDGVIYATEGSTANERDWHAVFNEKGELLEQVMELSLQEAPEPVRMALSQQVGADGAVHLEQAWEDGQTRYLSNSEANGEERHMVFTEDGQLVRYETWVEEPEFEEVE